MNLFSNIDDFGNKLIKFFENLNYSDIYPQIIALIRRSIVTNFVTGGRYGNNPYGGGATKWKPSRRAISQAGQTLRDKGLLLNSIQIAVENRPGKGFYLKLGSNLAYARIHQKGGRIKTKYTTVNMPARPYLVLQDEDINGIRQLVEKYMLTKIR